MMQRPTQTTRPLSPIRVRATLAALRAELGDGPTQITDAIPPVVSRALVPIQQPVRLPREQGYPYLIIVNQYEETSALVRMGVERYYQMEGNYPEVILMRAFRYLTYGMSWQYFYPMAPGAPGIPFKYGGDKFHDALFHNAGYDILLRGGLSS